MRNPLNSILAQNVKLKGLLASVRRWIGASGQISADLQTLVSDLEEATKVQESCTKLLTFYVEDLLCMAQIDKGTFRKNVSTFELREAITEIMSVQREKADFRQIDLQCQLHGMA